MGLLDGKVILITGAGGGLGKAHALACAAEGARVVVNDLGGTVDGSGSDDAAAAKVAAEIKAAGGEAIPNFDSVTDRMGCQRMVQAAVDTWGKLDVVVNNAGILRDKTFTKMTDEMWDAIIAVHLDGTYNVTKAAVPALIEAGGGSIINTSSFSGLIGNFGQSNYAAAKAGIYGFTRVLAMELRSKGIIANAIAPVAKTRMTDNIDMVEAEWTAEHVSPMVVFLASQLAHDRKVTGQVFGCQGPRFHIYEMQMNDGLEMPDNAVWTAEQIAENYDVISTFPEPEAPANDGAGDVVSQVFSHFPAGFKADAVSGWSAVFHWVVKGGTDQTVTIADGVCSVAQGLQGDASCTIKVPKDTLIAMFKGELDAQKAFMTGKASADNMGDLMKMGMAFDFDAVGAAFMAESGAEEADVVTDVFHHFPSGFKADAAPGWNAVFHWSVKGGTDQTVVVSDGACSVATGLEGDATCTIKVAEDVLISMFMGQLDPQKAFMTGKASADNMSDLMKLGMAFDFAAIEAAYRAAGGGSADGDAAAEDTGPKVWPIGKVYDGGYAFAEPDHMQLYAQATNDENPVYFGDDSFAPPMFHVRLFKELMFLVATDPELDLDLLRLVHGEHDATFHRPLKPWDLVHLRAKLESVEEKSSGVLVVSRMYGFVDGECAVEARTAYFIRAKRKPGEAKTPRPPAPEPPAPDLTATVLVTDDQSYRYAEASLDNNPIHIDPDTAKSAGLPGVILQGLCTMAMAGATATNQVGDSDPLKLRRLKARFVKPVLNDMAMQAQLWNGDEGAWKIALVSPDEPKTVFLQGEAFFA